MFSLAVNTAKITLDSINPGISGICEDRVSSAVNSFINGSELLELPGLSTLVGCLKKVHHFYRWYKLRNASVESTMGATALTLGDRFSVFVSLPTTAILILKCYLDMKKKYAELVNAYKNMPIAFCGEIADPEKPKSWCGRRLIDRTQKIAESTWILLRTAFEFAMILEDVRLFMNQDDKNRYVACVELAENIDDYVKQGTEELETLLGFTKGDFQKFKDELAQQLQEAKEKAEQLLREAAEAAEKAAREMSVAAVEIVEDFENDPYNPMGPPELNPDDVEVIGEVVGSCLKTAARILDESADGFSEFVYDVVGSSTNDFTIALSNETKDTTSAGLEIGNELASDSATIVKKIGGRVTGFVASEIHGEIGKAKAVINGATQVAAGVAGFFSTILTAMGEVEAPENDDFGYPSYW